jgi:hypothetical protein
MTLGTLSSLHSTGAGWAVGRPERAMERQRCLALLAGCAYDLGDDEFVSDDPRPAEFAVGVNASYHLE